MRDSLLEHNRDEHPRPPRPAHRWPRRRKRRVGLSPRRRSRWLPHATTVYIFLASGAVGHIDAANTTARVTLADGATFSGRGRFLRVASSRAPGPAASRMRSERGRDAVDTDGMTGDPMTIGGAVEDGHPHAPGRRQPDAAEASEAPSVHRPARHGSFTGLTRSSSRLDGRVHRGHALREVAAGPSVNQRRVHELQLTATRLAPPRALSPALYKRLTTLLRQPTSAPSSRSTALLSASSATVRLNTRLTRSVARAASASVRTECW